MNTTDTSADDFRVVDLFSPGEDRFASSASQDAAPAHVTPPRVGGEMPSSFVFAHPLFASASSAQDGERR